MSQPLHPAYRFATEAQWQACLFLGADRRTPGGRAGLRPFAPYDLPAKSFASDGAHAPAITDLSELLWRDDHGDLLRLPYGDEVPSRSPAPSAIASASRMVSTAGTLWAAGEDGVLQAFDVDSLTHLFTVDLGSLDLIDFTADGRDGIYALLAGRNGRRIVHIDCAGQVDASTPVAEPTDASALVFLGRSGKIVLLGSNGTKLYWIDPDEGRAQRVVLLISLRPCFDVAALGSDGCSRLFLAGSDGAETGGGHRTLLLDADGSGLGTLPVDRRPTGVTASGPRLFVTTSAGLLRFDPATRVPLSAGEVRAALLTPLLRSSAQTPQRWMRVEATVDLPPGCSIEIAYAAPRDAAQEQRARKLLSDRSVPPAQRLEQWRRELTPRTMVFHGDPQLPAGKPVVLSAPLQDERGDAIWVQVSLMAAPGGRMPRLSELAVLYPGPTLIEHLPAIYRSRELESGDFLRTLVGVLEAGTQNLDARIGDLGRNIHPASAGDSWLDFIAGWLGLPWDDALSSDQKRRIVARAAQIADGYGTRAGLEALLEGLMGEHPRRFHVVDLTAQYGIAMLAGGDCEGSRLPALLSGLPKSAIELGSKAVLGRARLPCGEPEKETARFLARIRIDVAAGTEERKAWSPWLQTLIDRMLPATVRAELRWLGANAFATADRLGEDLSLEGEPPARLGSDSVTGAARLGGRRRTTLPDRLSDLSTLH